MEAKLKIKPDVLFFNLIVIIGLFYIQTSATAQDQKVADSLILLYNQVELTDSAEITLLNEIAFHHNNLDSGFYYADLLIAKSEVTSNLRGSYLGYFARGTAYRMKGDLENAIAAYFSSADYASQLDNRSLIGEAYFALGDVYSSAENNKNSILYYNKAIEILRREDALVGLASALLNAGLVYNNLNRLDTALAYFQESDSIFERLDYTVGTAYALGSIGLIQAKNDDLISAEESLSQAIEILSDNEDNYAIADFGIQMADVYQQKEKMPQAIEYALNSYNVAVDHGLKEQIRDSGLKLSELYNIVDSHEKAYYYQSQYIAYRDSVNNHEITRKLADLRTEFEVSAKQKELELLTEEKRYQELFTMVLGFVTLFVAISAIILFRNNQQKKRANEQLTLQKAEMQLQNEEIEAQKEEISAQRDQLKSLNDSKDRFFSIISHDMRSPVNALKGLTTIVNGYLKRKDFDQLEDVMKYMETSSNQLSFLLNNLLNWALSQQNNLSFNPETLSINQIVEEVFDLFNSTARSKKIDLIKEVPEEIKIEVDRNSIMTVFRNLISNALKFTPENGKVTFSAAKKGEKVVISVSDTGVGMPEEKIKMLFNMGEKRSTYGTAGEKGTGLGLLLVKEFVELNNGQMEITSEEEKGTTFDITLAVLNVINQNEV